jgi:hypothetical protein
LMAALFLFVFIDRAAHALEFTCSRHIGKYAFLLFHAGALVSFRFFCCNSLAVFVPKLCLR